eukprot:12104-Heterococcus_DN1.PRE.7
MTKGAGPFPGLYLFTEAARMIRPVLHLESCKREWIGPLEQPFLEVACLAGDVRPGSTTHCELDPTNMLSLIARYVYVFTQHAYSAVASRLYFQTVLQCAMIVSISSVTSCYAASPCCELCHSSLNPARDCCMLILCCVCYTYAHCSLTPFSDYNQSPRNMYQCQMGKQTMGTPAHCLHPHKVDNKMYRILFPQAPLVQTKRHSQFQMDNYPQSGTSCSSTLLQAQFKDVSVSSDAYTTAPLHLYSSVISHVPLLCCVVSQGTNAVVAVISYTGFDMEDAMILNKSSYERGFGHASRTAARTARLLLFADHQRAPICCCCMVMRCCTPTAA